MAMQERFRRVGKFKPEQEREHDRVRPSWDTRPVKAPRESIEKALVQAAIEEKKERRASRKSSRRKSSRKSSRNKDDKESEEDDDIATGRQQHHSVEHFKARLRNERTKVDMKTLAILNDTKQSIVATIPDASSSTIAGRIRNASKQELRIMNRAAAIIQNFYLRQSTSLDKHSKILKNFKLPRCHL